MSKPHILFVCSKNKWRSPTAAKIYANDQRVEVKSAGLSGKSNHQISNKDVEWADLILTMEKNHKVRIVAAFRREIDLPPIEVLGIPDEYKFMDEELIELIRDGTEYNLENNFGV